jgi:hypothetical protein
MSSIYVIPGANQQAEQYDRLLTMLERRGHAVQQVQVPWELNNFTDYNAAVAEQLANSTAKDTLLGFSYGGILVLQQKAPGKRICAGTPDVFTCDRNERRYFDRVSRIQIHWDKFDPNIHHLPSTARGAAFVVGMEESERYKTYGTELAAKLGGTLTMIPKAPHDINHPLYVEGLEYILHPIKF